VATQAIAVGHAFRVEDLANLVQFVAVDAGRDQVRLLFPKLAADHLAVHAFDLCMTARAGLGNILLRNRRAWVPVRQHVVCGMTARAHGGHGQALPEQADTVNAVLVIFQNVRLREGPCLADRGVFPVAATAKPWNVDRGDGRLQVGWSQNVVRAVAQLATGRVGIRLGCPLTVDAGLVLVLLFTVTLAAIHPRQLVRVRRFLNIAVAGNAFERSVR
jgi:hypothetical protein